MAETEQYTIRRQLLKLIGAGFFITDAGGGQVGYCKQKAFRLREDLRFYTDPERTKELFAIRARQVIDFGASYDVTLPDGSVLGSLRRKGLASLARDSWLVFGPDGSPAGRIVEDSTGLALARRFLPLVAVLAPQRFHMEDASGRLIAVYRTHFNPIVYRLGVSIRAQHEDLDDLLILAGGCLLAAIEGRQDSA